MRPKFLLLVILLSCLPAISLAAVGYLVAPAAAQEAAELTIQVEPRDEIVQSPGERLGEFEKLLHAQNSGSLFFNPVKHAIRNAAQAGVSLETIVLLILLPAVASFIAAARHLVGVRGFGIFLPAALSIVFVAIGPVLGLGLFLLIVASSTVFRLFLRKLRLKLQYLPRMALILWFVVISVFVILFFAPLIPQLEVLQVSILPVLFLVLLAEDFTRVQLGKSIGVAVTLTSETLILALVSFAILSLRPVQYFAILNPEILLLTVAVFDIFLGRYVGLRVLELWRFRRLIRG
ncbi:MAG: 7TM domain-containing protein [bacterium]|nr:7TM domain-containing protein [bacterium]